MKKLLCCVYLSACLLIALSATALPSAAQVADTQGIPITNSDLARISDAELRALVFERLGAPPEAATPIDPAAVAIAIQAAFGQIRERLGDILGAYGELPGALVTAWSALTGGREAGSLGQFFLIFAISIISGRLIERLLHRPAGIRSEEHRAFPSFKQKGGLLFSKTVSHFLYILLFTGVASVVFFTLHDGEPRDRTMFAFYLSAIVIIRLIAGFAHAYLGLGHADMRIPAFTTAEAKLFYAGTISTVALGAIGFFTCALFAALGIHGNVHILMLFIVGSVVSLGLALTFLSNRAALSRDLSSNQDTTGFRRRFAVAYPWVMAVGTLLLWGALVSVASLDKTPLFGSALVTIGLLMFWPGLDAAAEREAARCLASDDQVSPAVIRVMRIGMAVGTLILLAIVWRVDLVGSGIEGGLETAVTRSLLEVGTVVLIAYAAWQTLRIWIDKKIAEEDAARGDDGVDMAEAEIGGTGLSRMRTLLPLFKRAGQIAVAVVAFMIILSSLGLNIGPILAGAGVVGLAIGFGSQTLVRDIVSGAFFLMDDAFRLGEYIDLGTVKGSVEKIATRSLQLRHHRGAFHTVPFGEIQTLTNYSRDWAIMKLKFRVPFDTDIEKARKALKRVGLELLDHPEIGPDFIQQFKSQGVVEVDDYGLIISTKFMSKPGKQFMIRRHAYAAVQKAFADKGIQFARPEVRVSMNHEEQVQADNEARTGLAAGAAAFTKISQPKPQAEGG